MKCKLNNKCEFGDLCQQATRHDSLTVLGCSSYKSKKPLTNEEWIKRANTEQLAETIAQYFYGWTTNSTPHDIILHSVVEWLKQPHTYE